MKNLTDIKYWDKDYLNQNLVRHDRNHSICKFIRNFIPQARPNQTFFEIGSYPGHFLCEFGDLGYSLAGIDLIEKNSSELTEWLRNSGYKINAFITGDFLELFNHQYYSVVGSFGFVEHFTNFEDIIIKHASFVEENGYLIITSPNFAGQIQRFLHKHFDKENMSKHYLPSMNPQIWAEILSGLGFQIVFSDYFGGFYFWNNDKLNGFKKFLFYFVSRIIIRLNKLLWFESRLFSCYCGIVAKKTQ